MKKIILGLVALMSIPAMAEPRPSELCQKAIRAASYEFFGIQGTAREDYEVIIVGSDEDSQALLFNLKTMEAGSSIWITSEIRISKRTGKAYCAITDINDCGP